jgi:uncharacterized SAM-binding protein YcdF (DUF218 family)
MKWNRIAATIGMIVIVSFLLAAFTPIVNMLSRAVTVQAVLAPSDAIVILGSGLMSDGTLNYSSLGRLVFGMRLYKQGLAPLLILSGPPRANTAPESTVRAEIATELGIPASAILEMRDVNTTRDEAQETATLLAGAGKTSKHVLLVTDSLHMLRSKMVFEAAGLHVSPAPSDDFPAIARAPQDRLILLMDLVMHSAGLVYYRLAGFI